MKTLAGTPAAAQFQVRIRNHVLLVLLWSLAVRSVTADNPRDDFCRRYAHQTTVIDDKLYIDGGWVNYKGFQDNPTDYSNTWLGYHDINEPVGKDKVPNLTITLNKPDNIPTVQGGVLWGDNVNKRFYLYGGEETEGYPEPPYHLWSYDILNDKWDDFGQPNTDRPPEVASFGAGVGVSETGMGYYLGGWVSNKSTSGWTQSRKMSSNFYMYTYDTNDFTETKYLPDNKPRAEGGMVWIPAGDPGGLLVYLGGIVSTDDNGTTAPQPLDEIFVFDAQGNTWAIQKATGDIPQNRAKFCMDVAWAPDKSSYNIYLWGGLSVPPPVVNATSFNDVYVLTIPSFTWVKVHPPGAKNATLEGTGHYSASCNMVKSMSQMFVIGGKFTNTTDCDYPTVWGQHSLWTGTWHNQGDNDTYWALYDPNVTTNVVPKDVYSIVGGNKEGGATVKKPKAGYGSDSESGSLAALLERRESAPERTPTRQVTAPTTPPPDSSGSSLSGGAIAGIVIGSIAGLAFLLGGWFLIARRHARRRRAARRPSAPEWRGPSYSIVSSMAGAPSMVSQQTSHVGAWMPPPPPPPPPPAPPPSELPTRQDNTDVVSELPQETVAGNTASRFGSGSSQGRSPAATDPDATLFPSSR